MGARFERGIHTRRLRVSRQEMADALDDFLSAQLDKITTRIRLAAAPTPDYAVAVQQLQDRIAALDAHNSKLATQCIRLATMLPPREPKFRDRFAWQYGSPPPRVAGSISRDRALQPSGIGGLSPPRFPRWPRDPSPSGMQASSEAQASEQLRKQLEKALSMHGELMAHVKKAAEEDAARRAEAEADRRPRSHIEKARKSIVCPVNAVEAQSLQSFASIVAGVNEQGSDKAVATAVGVTAGRKASATEGEKTRFSGIAAAGMAVLFALRLRARAASHSISEEEALALLASLSSRAAEWLRVPLRPIVQSIIADTRLHLDWGEGGGSGGALGFFRRRPSSDMATEVDKISHKLHELRVRTRSVLDALLSAVQDAPAPLLHSLNLLCHKRVVWPKEFPLWPSERAVLVRQKNGTDMATALGSVRLALGLIITRVVIQQLLLQPKEYGVAAAKPSSRAMSNLKALAAMLHYICHSALAGGEPGGELVAAADRSLEPDEEATQSFAPALGKLRQHGLPLLESWIGENRGAIHTWALTMLRAASSRGVSARSVPAAYSCSA